MNAILNSQAQIFKPDKNTRQFYSSFSFIYKIWLWSVGKLDSKYGEILIENTVQTAEKSMFLPST